MILTASGGWHYLEGVVPDEQVREGVLSPQTRGVRSHSGEQTLAVVNMQ